jgi:hypothetical protein
MPNVTEFSELARPSAISALKRDVIECITASVHRNLLDSLFEFVIVALSKAEVLEQTDMATKGVIGVGQGPVEPVTSRPPPPDVAGDPGYAVVRVDPTAGHAVAVPH